MGVAPAGRRTAPFVKVLITGGSSLMGARIADVLLHRGDEVVAFQRSRSASLPIGIEQSLGDVRDAAAVRDAASGCDAVIHLAAKVGVVGARSEYESINVDGTRHVVDAIRHHGIARFVHVSSPSVAHGGEPIVGGGADPAIPEHGTAWYPATKAVGEGIALDAASDACGVVAIRPHLVWGPGDTQLVGRIVERARAGRLALVGGGRALVDTTYIDNAVSALVAALDAVAPGAACSGRPYIIANVEPRPIREILAGICTAASVPFAPRDVPLPVAKGLGSVIERVWPLLGRDDEPPLTRFLAEQLGTAHWFDPRPARDALGWAPQVSIDEGFAALAQWFSSGSAEPA